MMETMALLENSPSFTSTIPLSTAQLDGGRDGIRKVV